MFRLTLGFLRNNLYIFTMSEIWKTIENYSSYMVSNMGRVKRKEGLDSAGHYRQEKMLSPKTDKDGYYDYTLCKDGKMKCFRAHRLVAEAFIPNPENKPCIDHINCVRSDNRVENLRWVTNQENHNNPLSLINHKNASSIAIIQYTKDGKMLRKWDSATEAAKELNLHHQLISKCCKGTYKSAGGYIWKYYDLETYLIGIMNNNIKYAA